MYKPNEQITEEIMNLMTFIDIEYTDKALETIHEIARLSFIDGTVAVLETIENK